jgi:hypothetical protein
MNFEDIKATWKAYDDKLAAHKSLSETMVRDICRERSKSILAAIKKNSLLIAGLFAIYVVFFTACIAGNAFDYRHVVYYIPLVLQLLVCSGFLLIAVNLYRNVRTVQLNNNNLQEALRQVIPVNDQFIAMRRKLGWLLLIVGGLLPCSFLPRLVQHKGLGMTLVFLVIITAIIGLLLLAARKWQWFPDSKAEALKENLAALESRLRELEAL